MSKYTKSARGQACTVRSPVCNGNPETVVLAHLNGAGTTVSRFPLQTGERTVQNWPLALRVYLLGIKLFLRLSAHFLFRWKRDMNSEPLSPELVCHFHKMLELGR